MTMAYPARQYRDPAEVVDIDEQLKVGCRACVHNTMRPPYYFLRCEAGQSDYPEETRHTCAWWASKRKRHKHAQGSQGRS